MSGQVYTGVLNQDALTLHPPLACLRFKKFHPGMLQDMLKDLEDVLNVLRVHGGPPPPPKRQQDLLKQSAKPLEVLFLWGCV